MSLRLEYKTNRRHIKEVTMCTKERQYTQTATKRHWTMLTTKNAICNLYNIPRLIGFFRRVYDKCTQWGAQCITSFLAHPLCDVIHIARFDAWCRLCENQYWNLTNVGASLQLPNVPYGDNYFKRTMYRRWKVNNDSIPHTHKANLAPRQPSLSCSKIESKHNNPDVDMFARVFLWVNLCFDNEK